MESGVFPNHNLLKMRIGHLTYNWEGTYLLKTKGEAEKVLAFTL